MTLDRTKYLRDLRRSMVQYFEMDELETLAFDLAIDWGELSGNTKFTKSQSLIKYLAARGRLGDLLILLGEERPNVEWPDILRGAALDGGQFVRSQLVLDRSDIRDP